MFIGKKTNQDTGPLRIQATQTAKTWLIDVISGLKLNYI